MKRITLSALFALIAMLLLFGGAYAAQMKFRSLMVPDEIVPLPVNVDSNARGTAKFKLSNDEMTAGYHLNVTRIDKITMAHIHQYVGDGKNGPIVAWLYPSPTSTGPGTPTGRIDGRLGQGVINPDNLRNGFTWEQLLDLLRTGQAYVNVHTSEAPAGEINGHIH